MRALAALLLTVSLPAAPVLAGEPALGQLPAAGDGGFSLELPPPQASAEGQAALEEQYQLLPFPPEAEFLVKGEALHDSRPEPFAAEMEALPGKGAAAERPKVPYLAAALKEAKEQGVDVSLILAVMRKESTFDPKAYNPSGAVGLMQVLPSTAKWLGLKDTKQLWTPAVNIKYGVKYLKYLYGEFGEGSLAELTPGDMQGPGVQKMLAAYNAGPGNVRKYKGVPPFKETRTYVQKVIGFFAEYEGMAL